MLERPVAGGEPPEPWPIFGPPIGIRHRIGVLGKGRPPRVLEVINAALPHVRVANAAKIDPHVGVLVAEERCEPEMLVS